MICSITAALVSLALLTSIVSAEEPTTCTYSTSSWNVKQKRSVEARTVSHAYSELADEEVDKATGCTVCSEDQMELSIPGIAPFKLCRKIAPDVEAALNDLIMKGFPVKSIKGYLVIKSRGEIDSKGNRTGFSNHSYGAAVDINRELNGLYDNCYSFGPSCRLVLGGRWQPETPGTNVDDGPSVKAMKGIGLKWGGQIAGRQKDFMHFSPTGY